MVVLWPTRIEMINQMLPGLGIKPVKVLIRKSAQQQLRLIEPTGVRRGVERPEARMRGEVGLGVMINMRRPVVDDEMDAPRSGIAAFDLPDSPQEVLMVVGLQTTSPHLAIVDIERNEERHRPVPLILKLAALDLSPLHGLLGDTPSQRLEIRFLIQAEHQFAPLIQPLHPFITPQDLGRQAGKLVIKLGRLPIAAAMRLQAGRRQDPGHGRIGDRIHHRLLNHHLLEAPAVPTGQGPSIRCRLSAGHALDLDPLQRGKKRAPTPFFIKDRVHSTLLVTLPQMPETLAAPSKPASDFDDPFAPIQGQQGTSPIRHPYNLVQVPPIGIAESVLERFASLHPTPSFLPGKG